MCFKFLIKVSSSQRYAPMLLERWQACSTIDDPRYKENSSVIYDLRSLPFLMFRDLRSMVFQLTIDDRGTLPWSWIVNDVIDDRDRFQRSTIYDWRSSNHDRDRQNSWSMIDTASRSTIDMFTNPQVTFCNITSKTKVFFANKFECVTFSWKVTSKE